jgi:hypothetical protein
LPAHAKESGIGSRNSRAVAHRPTALITSGPQHDLRHGRAAWVEIGERGSAGFNNPAAKLLSGVQGTDLIKSIYNTAEPMTW